MNGNVNIRPITNGFVIFVTDGGTNAEVYCEDFSDVIEFLKEIEDDVEQFADGQRDYDDDTRHYHN